MNPHIARRRHALAAPSAARTCTALALACAAALAAVPARTAHAQAAAAASVTLSLPAQPLPATLAALSRQFGASIGGDAALLEGKTAPALQGAFTLQQALEQVLKPNGLVTIGSGASALTVVRAPEIGTTTLPPVRVSSTAERDTATGPVNGFVAMRSSTATKTDTPLVETPQSVSVIGRDEMDARGALDVMQAVRYSPGVAVDSYGPDNRGWEYIALRGFDTFDSTYQDGLVQKSFGISYFLSETYGVERLEVLRGPSSMVFGQGDVGGVVNRVTKKANGERIREVALQYGSFDRKQLALDLGDSFGDGTDTSWRVVGLALDTHDQDEYPDGRKLTRKRSFVAPSVRWQPNAKTSLTVLGEYLKNDSPEDPYFYSTNHVLTNVKMGEPSYTGLEQAQAYAGYRFETEVADGWTLRQNFRYGDVSLKRRAVWVDELDADGHTLHRVARSWNDPMNQGALDTHVQGVFRTGAAEHTVLLGLDLSRMKGTAERYRGTAPDLDLLAPVYGQPVAQPQDPVAHYTQTSSQAGLYVQDQVKLDERWLFTLGGRHDRVRSKTDDRLDGTVTEVRDNAFSGRAGIGYLLDGGWAPYAAYSESFLPNEGLDSDGNPFKPTRGKQVELGVKYQPAGSRTMFTAALFDLRKTNVVTYDNVTFDARQVGLRRARGLELEAKTELSRGLSATASYTRLDVKVLESADATEAGKKAAVVPDQSAAFWLDYAIGHGFVLGGGMSYVGERQNDEANTSSEGGYALADASLRYELGSWRLALNATNLFNRKYNSICYHGECYQGAERAATATVRYRF